MPAGAVLDYYERVRAAIGPAQAQRAVRLYMVPGMIECNGGPGTDTFDLLGVMRRWVERNQAPNEVIASRVERGKVVRTRPLCPYPQVGDLPRPGEHGRREQLRLQVDLPPARRIGPAARG